MRIRLLRLYLFGLALFTLFWWPMSHWFYPDWYHHLLGFKGYDYALVKIIGTTGVVPVLGMFFTAWRPLQNRDFMIVLLIFFVLLAGTNVFLIREHGFPAREYFNVALLCGNTVILALLYPWHAARKACASHGASL